ncbi:hypothetical protein MGYG_08885 [Nannizzia gypsea CBS 118893]|uniref:Uncharacterized protein n=1 Tax=Arthroderma gypseum (strain ATCC MYA-4604 / CBS 118893) TaxID=535722 RepID=E5R3Q2_ARTGP|nr:hypothetical protein MGYG_08885 [Nannizzia gypsea CBS 118893]EFQ97176.1 hypothetical protein MGYG_08885 [Nannizzia gypsea CBS 118893]
MTRGRSTKLKHAVHDQQDPDFPRRSKPTLSTHAALLHQLRERETAIFSPLAEFVWGTRIQAFMPRSRLDRQTPIWPPRAPLPPEVPPPSAKVLWRRKYRAPSASSPLLRPARSGMRPESPEPLDQAHGEPWHQAPLRRSKMLQSEGRW